MLSLKPYDVSQITAILRHKWEDVDTTLIAPNAIEICARKIAAESGDLRKANNVCRSAIEYARRYKKEITIDIILLQINSDHIRSIVHDLTIHQKTVLICIVKLQNDHSLLSKHDWTLRMV